MELTTIACDHQNCRKIDGEQVCTRCGMVIDTKVIEAVPHESQSITNIFERHTVGGKEILPKTDETKNLKKYFHNSIAPKKTNSESKILSKFSNVCQKLRLSPAESDFALTMFNRGRRQKTARQIPLVAIWSIYRSVQSFANPKTTEEIRNMVKFEFNRSTMPNMTKIIYVMSDVKVPPIDREKKELYFFRITTHEMIGGAEFDPDDYAIRIKNAWNAYKHMILFDSDKTRAKKAIAWAFGVKK